MAIGRSNPFFDSFDHMKTSMQSLRALRTKYERDYLPFFQELSGLYKIGPNKRKSDQTVNLIKRTLVLLENIIAGNTITTRDTTSLYSMVDDIEELRIHFIEQAAETRALRERIEKVTEKVGVGLEELKPLPSIARKAVRRDVRERRRVSLGDLHLPRAGRIGGELLGGLGAAAFGPFMPLARMGLGLGRDIAGLGRSLIESRREKRQSQFESLLHPVASGTSGADLEALLQARGRGHRVEDLRGYSRRTPQQQAEPLAYFFDRGAYRSRWTKELLREMRGISKGKTGLLGGLGQSFRSLGTAIGPFIGKAGLYAALAIGVAASTKKFGQLDLELEKLSKAQKNRHKVAVDLQESTEALLERVREQGLEPLAKARDVPSRQVAMDIIWRERRATQEEWSSRGRWSRMKDALLGRMPQVVPFYERLRQIEEMSPSPATRSRSLPAELAPEGIPGITDLTEEVRRLVDQMQQDRVTSIPSPGLGNMFDSADPITGQHADGSLTMGE